MSLLELNEGFSLHYTVKGNGIPMIFIHPPVLNSANFKYQLDELSQEFKVITFDIRGHGRSQASTKSISYPLIVQDIVTILDHLEIKEAYICGYSTGGSIALEFLLTHSNRALGGIVISGMPCVRDQYLKKKISNGIKLAKVGAVPLLAASIAWSNSDNKEMFLKLFSAARKGDAKNIEEYYLYSLTYDCTTQLKNIKLPVLLLFGKDDKPFHPYAQLLQDQLPANELMIIDHVKHQLPTKKANKVNDMIRQFINNKTSLKNHH